MIDLPCEVFDQIMKRWPSSRDVLRRFPPNTPEKTTPVMFAPGRLRPVTHPIAQSYRRAPGKKGPDQCVEISSLLLVLSLPLTIAISLQPRQRGSSPRFFAQA